MKRTFNALCLSTLCGSCGTLMRRRTAAIFATALLTAACSSQGKDTIASIGATAHDTPLTRNGRIFEFDVPRCGTFGVDGRLAVCEGSENQMIVFDSAGSYKFTFGRRGAGPGEFHTIQGVYFDRTLKLLIWDSQRRRMATVDTSGKLISDKRIVQMEGWQPRYLGQDTIGRFVYMERTSFIPGKNDPEGLIQSWTNLLVFDSTTRIPVVIDSMVLSDNFAIGRGFQRVTTGIPFAGSGDAVLSSNRLIVGYSGDTVLVSHDLISGEVDTIPFPVAAYPVTRSEWERAWEKRFARPSEFNERIQAAKENIPMPRYHPRFVRLLATPRGTIAAYVPTDSTQKVYEIRCFQIAEGDTCPAVRTTSGEVVLAITSGVAAVVIEQPDGTWRTVLRSVMPELDITQTATEPSH